MHSPVLGERKESEGTAMHATGAAFEAPNGLKFTISVADGYGIWQCQECGAEGATSEEAADNAESEAQILAAGHSRLCPASRGHGEAVSATPG